MSQNHNQLNHATWECKYHVVFTPMYRKEGAVWANQAALGHSKLRNFSWPQILGEGLLHFDGRAGRGDDLRLHQKSRNRGQAVGLKLVLIKSLLLYQNPS